MDEQLAQLIELAQAKELALGRILTLTLEQNMLLKADAVEALTENLEAKQRAIDEIDGLDDAFQGLYRMVKDRMQAESVPSGRWDTLQACISDVRRHIDEILVLEQENSKLAAQRMESYRHGIHAQKQSRRAVRGYQAPGDLEGGFDRKK